MAICMDLDSVSYLTYRTWPTQFLKIPVNQDIAWLHHKE